MSNRAYAYQRLSETLRQILADFGPETGWSLIESAVKSQLNNSKDRQGTDIPADKIKHEN
jgi:hypothetical protein